MIEILMKRNFFHIGDEDLAIDVAYFVLGQYYDCSENCSCPIGETVGYPGQEVWLDVVDWLRRDVVSGECYSRS